MMTNIKKVFISVLMFGGLGLVVLIGHDNMKKQRLQAVYGEAELPDTFASTRVVSGSRQNNVGSVAMPMESSTGVHATSRSVQQRSGYVAATPTGISVAPRFTTVETSAYATISGGSASATSYRSAAATSGYNTGLVASAYVTGKARGGAGSASNAVAEPFSDSRPSVGISRRFETDAPDATDPNLPEDMPLGDGLWLLLLCCGAFVAKRRLSKRKDENAE